MESNDKTEQLCPQCQTGKDSYLLDNKSPVCPYIDFHNGKECIKFKPLRTISKNA